MANVIEMYHGTFLRHVELYPVTSLVFAGTSGLGILSNSKWIVVDGTFDLCEGRLILTTIMGYHDGVALPCAYLLSQSRDKDNYKSFLQTIKYPAIDFASSCLEASSKPLPHEQV